jgi:hypothetical protein
MRVPQLLFPRGGWRLGHLLQLVSIEFMGALDTTLQTGLARFHRGEFHSAHDAWEEGWQKALGAERHLFQALVQLAAGFHQWSRGKAGGAATLFARARGHLGTIPSLLLGVEVSELELELSGWQESAERGESVPTSPRLRALGAPDPKSAERHRPRCPYCGERVSVHPDAVGVAEETYVEDCPVCCRPWTVHDSRDGVAVSVTLGREDD